MMIRNSVGEEAEHFLKAGSSSHGSQLGSNSVHLVGALVLPADHHRFLVDELLFPQLASN